MPRERYLVFRDNRCRFFPVSGKDRDRGAVAVPGDRGHQQHGWGSAGGY